MQPIRDKEDHLKAHTDFFEEKKQNKNSFWYFLIL